MIQFRVIRSLRACVCACFDANDLYVSKEKDVRLERVRITQVQVMAMLLDFEEK